MKTSHSAAFVMAIALLFAGQVVGQDLSRLEQRAVRAAVAKIAPSVVQIETVGGLEAVDGYLASQGPTSGLLLDSEGHVLTSAISFVQMPAAILVRVGEQRLPAKLLASDLARKLVLLKIDPPANYVPALIVPREEIRVGQTAIAVGKTLNPNAPNVSTGIVSALNRIWGRAIQTDAKISPLNYGGPLIDIHGRILGILVPLSPDATSAVAGTDWYDSGIGFAVPLADITAAQLDRLKRGENLKPGLIGITLKGQNTYADKPLVALCAPGSPAAKAGLRADDLITEIDGIAVQTHADVRHAIGRKLAGDVIHVSARRGESPWNGEFELVETIAPFDLPFFGILPTHPAELQAESLEENPTQSESGVTIRAVLPESPAAIAGLKTDDRILRINTKEVADAASLREILSREAPGSKVTLACRSGGQERSLEVTLARQDSSVPSELAVRADWQKVFVGLGPKEQKTLIKSEIAIPEETGSCHLWSPLADATRTDVRLGLVIWLAAPGKLDDEAVQSTWGPGCFERGFAVLVPRPHHDDRWDGRDAEFIRKTTEQALKQLPIDPDRIAVIGDATGGSMAYLYGFAHRHRIRGIGVIDAAIPLRLEPRGNDPENRLFFLLGSRPGGSVQGAMQADSQRLRGIKFPVADVAVEGTDGLNPNIVETYLRWADTLDRI